MLECGRRVTSTPSLVQSCYVANVLMLWRAGFPVLRINPPLFLSVTPLVLPPIFLSSLGNWRALALPRYESKLVLSSPRG